MFNNRPIALNYDTKNELTVTASSGSPQLLGELTGPVQVRIINYDTVRCGFKFGTQAGVTTLDITEVPTMPPGVGQMITVMPNSDGSPVYWNIIGATSPAGNTFEVTLGTGV